MEACPACQMHRSSQQRKPNRLTLEYVDCPMQCVGIDFFERKGAKYLFSWTTSAGCRCFTK